MFKVFLLFCYAGKEQGNFIIFIEISKWLLNIICKVCKNNCDST